MKTSKLILLFFLLLLFLSCSNSHSDKFVSCDDSFRMIKDNNLDLMKEHLLDGSINFSCKFEWMNIVEWTIREHKNEMAILLIKEAIDEKGMPFIEENDLLGASMSYGNYLLFEYLVNKHEENNIKLDNVEMIKKLFNFIFVFNDASGFENNDSELLQKMDKRADYKIIDVYRKSDILDITSLDEKGRTLLFSIISCCPNQLDYLLDKTEVDINKIDEGGNTVLDILMESYMESKPIHPINEVVYYKDRELFLELFNIILKHNGKMTNNENPKETLCTWSNENDIELHEMLDCP